MNAFARWGVLVAAVSGAGGLLLPLAQSGDNKQGPPVLQDLAWFRYTNGASLVGDFTGKCSSMGLRFHPERNPELLVTTQGAMLTIFRTTVNWTVLFQGTPDEIVSPLDGHQTNTSHQIPAGALRLRLGHGVLLSPAYPWSTMTFVLHGANLTSDPVVAFVDTELAYPSPFDEQRVMFVMYPLDGPTRLIHSDQETWEGTGGLRLFFDSSETWGPDGFHLKLPRYREVTTHAEARDAAAIRTSVYTHARLESPNATLHVSTGAADLACGGLHLDFDGGARFHNAFGRVGRDEASIDFAQRELELVGRFELHDVLEKSTMDVGWEGWSKSRAAGAFEAVGLDFQFVPLPSPKTNHFQEVGLWALLVGALAALLSQWSRLVGLFYTRFNESKALEHPTRAHLWAAIEETPGLILATLAERLGRPLGVIRHHVRILEVVGLVKSLRVGSARHLYPKTYSLPVARRQERWGRDAPARFLVERLKETPLSLTGARHEVRIHFGFSRMGAWKVVRRAVQDGLVRVEPESHRLQPVT